MPIIVQDEKTISLPIKKVTDEEYAYIRMRGITNSLPTKILDNGGYPNRELYFWPVPNDGSKAVELWVWEPLEIYDLDEELNLPPGYERYYIYALAMELCDLFGKEPTKEVVTSMMEAEAAVRTLNQVDYVTESTDAMLELRRGGRPYHYIDFVSGAAMLPRETR